jgi:hypothetical protein
MFKLYISQCGYSVNQKYVFAENDKKTFLNLSMLIGSFRQTRVGGGGETVICHLKSVLNNATQFPIMYNIFTLEFALTF